MKPAVYIVDPYHEAAIEKLQANTNIEVVLPHDERCSGFADNATAILLRSDTRLNAASIQKFRPGLKYIVKQGVGVDNIDLKAAKEKGIKVFNTPGLNGEAVAELTLGLALALARRIGELDHAIHCGQRIVRSKMLGKSLFGKTLGVIGMGNIGLEVARKWRGAMGGTIVALDPFAPADAWSTEPSFTGAFNRVELLQDLLEASDVITVHVPLTKSTKNLIGADELAKMKNGAILLNCARGGIVDETALLAALQSGHIFGAGLDAVEHEPPNRDVYGDTLLEHPRVIITPHVGASTEENQMNSGLAAAQIVLELLDGNQCLQDSLT
nr:hydroxypyruvate reductase [Quercus suber]